MPAKPSRESILELNAVNDLHALCERLVHGAALGDLSETHPLGVSERSMNRNACLDLVNPTVAPVVAIYAVVGVDPVKFDPYFNR